MSKKIINRKVGLFFFFISMIFFVIASAQLDEGRASKSLLVNYSKRMMAELGGFVVNYVYDPGYEGEGEVIFGPKNNTSDDSGTKYKIKNAEDLQRYLDAIKLVTCNPIMVQFRNHVPLRAAYKFDYQPFNNEKLKLLSKRYRLFHLVKGMNNDFDKLIVLRNWVKTKWAHGNPQGVDYNFNALDILERAERGERFWCSEYATVFVQCALSIGYQARYVGLFKGHVVAEVWLNNFARWAVMDVDNDLHYLRNGVPLNALELHRAWGKRKMDDIQMVVGPERKIADNNSMEEQISYYHEFYVRMRNDWFAKKYPHWHPKANSIMNGLEWQDEYTSNNILVAKEAYLEEDIYFPLNVTSIEILNEKIGETKGLRIKLNTFTPSFDHFIVKVDDLEKKIVDDTFFWKIHAGRNTLEVVSVNVLGVVGVPSRISINCGAKKG